MEKRLKIGLVAATVVGILIGLFPVYGKYFSKYLLGFSPNMELQRWETELIEGVVMDVNTAAGKVRIDGVEVTVRGHWIVEINGMRREVTALELLENYIKPGMIITIVYRESGRWGHIATEIKAPNFKAWLSE